MFVIVKSDPASGVGTTLVRNLEFVPGFFEGWKKYFLDYQFFRHAEMCSKLKYKTWKQDLNPIAC